MKVKSALKEFLVPPVEEMTEGEEFISDFLEDEGYDFRREVEIRGLIGDSKGYRVADFYLPGFKLYIEFLGHWNTSPEKREAYREKKRVYAANKIPCVYIYPENLGILEHSFRRRCKEELHNHGMRKKLFFFNLVSLWKSDKFTIIGLLVALYLVLDRTNDTDTRIGGGLLVFLFAHMAWANALRVFRLKKQYRK